MKVPRLDKTALARLASMLEAQFSATKNLAAIDVLRRFSNLIHDAKQGKIDSPYRYNFFPEESWEDGKLLSEPELAETAAQFRLQVRALNSKGQANA